MLKPVPPFAVDKIPPKLFKDKFASFTSIEKAENTELLGAPPNVILLEPAVTFCLDTVGSAPILAAVKVLVVQSVGCPVESIVKFDITVAPERSVLFTQVFKLWLSVLELVKSPPPFNPVPAIILTKL